jgi:hypothetical protein
LPLLGLGPGTEAGGLTGSRTAACIEGFPRSGNSLAVRYFQHRNPDARLAHHVHVPAQLIAAVRLGVPRLLLIREPREATLSLLVSRDGALRPGDALGGWVGYHRALLPHLTAIPILSFERLIGNPTLVAAALNAAFGTRFAHRPLSEVEIEAVERDLRRSWERRGIPEHRRTRPSPLKQQRKLGWVAALDREPLLAEARELHRRVLAAGPATSPPRRADLCC